MGIDLRLRFRHDPARIDTVRAIVRKHDAHGWVSVDGEHAYVESLYRLFSEGYERVHWPTIRAMIEELRPVVADLRYGGDEDHFCGESVDDDMLARLDALWETSPRRKATAT